MQGRNSIMGDGRGYWALTSIQEAQAPKLDRFSNPAAALANLCISVHYGKLNLMLPSSGGSWISERGGAKDEAPQAPR